MDVAERWIRDDKRVWHHNAGNRLRYIEALGGLSEVEMAKAMEVSLRTYRRYKDGGHFSLYRCYLLGVSTVGTTLATYWVCESEPPPKPHPRLLSK